MADEDPLAEVKRDWHLQKRVVAALTERKMPSLRRLQVLSRDGVVTLRGSVHTFYEKQLSHHSARLVRGVARVVDEIEVAPAPTFSDPQSISRAAIGGIALLLMLSIAALAATSHGGDTRLAVFPVKGRVFFNDQAVPGAVVVFHPKGAPDAPHPRGTVDKQGNFSLTTYQAADGAPEGEYLVTIEWPQLTMEGGDAHYVNALPPEYLSFNTTKLQATIWDKPENHVLFTLRGNLQAAIAR